jgi:hypothetical protein
MNVYEATKFSTLGKATSKIKVEVGKTEMISRYLLFSRSLL